MISRMRSASITVVDRLVSVNEASERSIQRNTVWIVLFIIAFVSLGIIVYHSFLGWDLLDAIYFITVSLATVGYGDLHPNTYSERLFTSFYLLFGAFFLTTVLSIQLALVAENNEMLEKERNARALKEYGEYARVNEKDNFFTAVARRASSIFSSKTTSFDSAADKEKGSASRRLQREFLDNANNTFGEPTTAPASLVALQQSAKSSLSAPPAHTPHSENSESPRLKNSKGANPVEQPNHAISIDKMPKKAIDGSKSEVSSRHTSTSEEFDRFAENHKGQMTFVQVVMSQLDEDIRVTKRNSVINFGIIFVVLLISAAIMGAVEGWNYNLSFYWAVVTVTTVGYGDAVPVTTGGKVFCIFYIIFGIYLVAKALGEIMKYPLMLRTKKVEEKVVQQFCGDLSEEKLNAIFQSDMYARNPNLRSNPLEMSKMEFIVLILTLMNKVEEKDIILASKIFGKLDVNGDGVLNHNDMKSIRKAAKERREQQERDDAARAIEELKRKHIEEETSRNTFLGSISGQFKDLLQGLGVNKAEEPATPAIAEEPETAGRQRSSASDDANKPLTVENKL